MTRSLCSFVLLAALCVAAAPVAAQPAGALSGTPASSVVMKAHAHDRLSTGDVGAELLSGPAARSRLSEGGRAPEARLREALQEDEVATDEFTRGAIIGGAAGVAAGALVGALLGGGESTARWETALPGALAGLAVGAPAGVYVRTERAPRYLWGTAGAAGTLAGITAIYLIER